MDVETGGLYPEKTSLLSMSFAICNIIDDIKKINIIDSLTLNVKPDDSVYHVNPSALKINGINLIEHDKKAIKYSEASSILLHFIEENNNLEESYELVPVGYNIMFDLGFIYKYIINKQDLSNYISYHFIDLASIVNFLLQAGYIDVNSISLKSIAGYLGIKVNISHNAIADVETIIRVFEKLLEKITTCEQVI